MGAKVNLTTGKIVGAKKDSFAWWHEKGHIIYNNMEDGISNGYKMEMWLFSALTFAIISIPLRFMWFFSFLSIAFFWYYFIYEEVWCNAYARIKLKKGGKHV